MYETEKHLKKKGKQAGLFRLSAVAAALVMALPGISMATDSYGYSTPGDGAITSSGNLDLSGSQYGLLVSDDKGAVLTGSDISISGPRGIGAFSYWNDKDSVGNVNAEIGSSSGKVTINANGVDSSAAYGIVLLRNVVKGKVYQAPKVTIAADSLVINANSDTDSRGIHVGGNTTETTNPDNQYGVPELIINANNTIINATSATEGAARGIVAMSQGVVKINGNLEVNADDAIVARGDAVVHVNEAGDKTVKLNGDIDFNYDQKTSGTKVDADVLVNLTGADSYWNGNAKVTWGTGVPDETKSDVSGLKLNLSDGAQWNPTVITSTEPGTDPSGTTAIAINNLGLNAGIINIKTAGQEVKVDNLSGTGGTVNIAAQKQGDTLTNAKLQVKQVDSTAGTPHLDVNVTGLTADDVTDADMSQLASSAVTDATGTAATGITQKQKVIEGIEGGTREQIIDENGNVIQRTQAKNTGTAALQKIGAMNFLTFRAQTNDVSKRMGDLRSMPQADGMWARAVAGQSEYKSIHNTYQTLQIGGDKRIGNIYVGGTASYTDGEGKLDNGSTDDKNWSFGLYGGWIADDGQYVDIIVKRHKFQSDYDISYLSGATGSGSMDTWGTSASVEYGWRLGIANTNYYIEPQAELMIGHLNGVSFDNRTSAGNIRVKQEGIDTAVGRVGIAAGWISPEKTGSAYLKASVLHDWEGDAKIRAGRTSYTEEMGGTWGEFALGGTWNINKNFAAYGEVETTAGNPVRTTYQVSGGIRYSF